MRHRAVMARSSREGACAMGLSKRYRAEIIVLMATTRQRLSAAYNRASSSKIKQYFLAAVARRVAGMATGILGAMTREKLT